MYLYSFNFELISIQIYIYMRTLHAYEILYTALEEDTCRCSTVNVCHKTLRCNIFKGFHCEAIKHFSGRQFT